LILEKKNKKRLLKQTKKSQHIKNSKKLKLKDYVILKITSHDLCLNRDAKKNRKRFRTTSIKIEK